MAKIFISRQMPGKAFDELKGKHEVDEAIVEESGKISREELLERVKGAEAILTNLTEKIDMEVFDAAGPNLKIVANYAVGFDNIDWKEAKKRGIFATNTPSNLGDAVAEFTITMMLALSRRIVEADRFARAGKYNYFDPSIFLGLDLSGKTFGVIGAGTIGSVAAQRAKAVFDMKIVYSGRHQDEGFESETGATMVSLDELCHQADVISLHVPLTEQTRHLLSFDQFKVMKPTAIVINTSRGPVVHESALAQAIQEKRIWGAALDVFSEEMPTEIQDLDPRDWKTLTAHENVIMTPHIASATVEAREEMARMAVDNILAALDGYEPPYLVPGYKEE